MVAETIGQAVAVDSAQWQWNAAAHRVEQHLGRQSLLLEDGVAWLRGVSFTSGAIDFDVALTAGRGFPGAVWHLQDGSDYEEFYLRPHQSGNPDATQYTPVFNGISGWQLYHGDRFSAPLVHRFDAWVHVRVLFSGAQAEIYVDDMGKPLLFVEELRRGAEPGAVGLRAGKFSSGHFANFSYTVMDPPAFRARPPAPTTAPAGLIASWWVSDAFPESRLAASATLAPEDLAAQRWTRLATERSGLANLARVQGVDGRRNTVFARQIVRSDRVQSRLLDFGFCNRIRVYLNGRLLYRGDDSYRSRDYRFLGSIGFFDALDLPLVRGKNEVVMAVSAAADLGGWGVQAKLEDPSALTVGD